MIRVNDETQLQTKKTQLQAALVLEKRTLDRQSILKKIWHIDQAQSVAFGTARGQSKNS